MKAIPLRGARVGPKRWQDRMAVSLRAAPLGLACALLPYALGDKGLDYLKLGPGSQSPPMIEMQHALTAVHASMVELPGQGDARVVAELASSARILALQDQQLTTAVQKLEAQYATLARRYETSLSEQKDTIHQILGELRRLYLQQETIAARVETNKSDNALIPGESREDSGTGGHHLRGHGARLERVADQRPNFESAMGDHLATDPDAARSSASNLRLSALPSSVFAAMQIARGLESTRARAVLSKQEQTFTIDVEKRLFGLDPGSELREIDSTLQVVLDTASSERINEHSGRIRFFPDGSSTGGRIQVLHGNHGANASVDWSTGSVTVQVVDD